MSSHKLKIAIMGMGGRAGCWAAEFFDSNAPAPRLADWMDLVAYCDLKPATETIPHRKDVLAALAGRTEYYPDYAKMLSRGDIDAVFIATPDNLHVENAVQAMEAGKHVLIEKAVSLDVAGAARVGKTAERLGRVCFLGLVLRYANLYAKLRSLAAGGGLGQVLQIEGHETVGGDFGACMSRWRYGRREYCGTMMLCKATHMLDVMNFIAGARPAKLAAFGGQDYFRHETEITEKCSTCPRSRSCRHSSDKDEFCPFSKGFDWPDNAVAVIEYANGLRGTFNFDLFSTTYERSFGLRGTRGWASGRDRNPPHLEINSPSFSGLWDFRAADTRGHGGGDLRLIRHFFDCIEQGQPSPFTTEAIVDSVAVALAIEEAWKTEKVIDLATWRAAQQGI